jgi:NADH dehydrogenase FAD-containing subunit
VDPRRRRAGQGVHDPAHRILGDAHAGHLDQERRGAVDPDNNTVTCADGATYAYDVLVDCPGIQLD